MRSDDEFDALGSRAREWADAQAHRIEPPAGLRLTDAPSVPLPRSVTITASTGRRPAARAAALLPAAAASAVVVLAVVVTGLMFRSESARITSEAPLGASTISASATRGADGAGTRAGATSTPTPATAAIPGTTEPTGTTERTAWASRPATDRSPGPPTPGAAGGPGSVTSGAVIHRAGRAIVLDVGTQSVDAATELSDLMVPNGLVVVLCSAGDSICTLYGAGSFPAAGKDLSTVARIVVGYAPEAAPGSGRTGVTIYRDYGEQGPSQSIALGGSVDLYAVPGAVGNDAVSSVRVEPGAQALVCTDHARDPSTDQLGRCWAFGPGDHDMPADANDVASLVIVTPT